MINCDVFILISILIVVLLLIYNRNKRDKQIEGFFINPLGGGGGWGDSVRDNIKVAGMPSNLGVQKVIFDIANEDGDNNINTKDMEYDKVREKLKSFVTKEISQIESSSNGPAATAIKNLAMYELGTIVEKTPGELEDGDKDRGAVKKIKDLAMSAIVQRTSSDTSNAGKQIKELAQQAVRNGANGVHDKIKELARAEFDKKFSELQGAAIQLNKSGIRCTKNGSPVSCPDSIVRTGAAPAAAAEPEELANLQNGVYTLKASNGNYCSVGPQSSDGDQTSRIVCDRTSPDAWEKFTIMKNDGGTYSLQGYNRKYCANVHNNNRIVCNSGSPGNWGKFNIMKNDDDTYSLKGHTGKYCSRDPSDNSISSRMVCDRPIADSWEKFTIVKI